jgi:hypothetical protein
LIQREIENGRYGFLSNSSDFKNKYLTSKIDEIVEYLKDSNYGKKENRSSRFQRSGLDRGGIERTNETSASNSRGETETDARGRGALGESKGSYQGDEGERGNLKSSISTDQENGDNVSDSVSLNFGTGDVEEFMTLPRVKELVKSVKVPERITSMSQAARWTYDTAVKALKVYVFTTQDKDGWKRILCPFHSSKKEKRKWYTLYICHQRGSIR